MPSNSPTVPAVPQMPIPSITPSSFSDDRIDSRAISNDEGGGRTNPLPSLRDTASSSSFSTFQNNISSVDMSTGIWILKYFFYLICYIHWFRRLLFNFIFYCVGVSIADDFLSSSGSNLYNSSRVRMLEFNVQHGERIIHLKVSTSKMKID